MDIFFKVDSRDFDKRWNIRPDKFPQLDVYNLLNALNRKFSKCVKGDIF